MKEDWLFEAPVNNSENEQLGIIEQFLESLELLQRLTPHLDLGFCIDLLD